MASAMAPLRFTRAQTRTGILLFSLGVFLFALNDALAKWLVADYTVGQLLLVRSLGAAPVLAFLVWRNPVSLRLEGQWALHALRIACMTGDSFSFYFATRTLPLADVMAFYLAAPLIITALSGPFLGERVGPFRWTAVLVGFGGVLIALRPNGTTISADALIALAGSCMFAVAITTTSKLRGTQWQPLVTWQFVGGAIVGAATSPLGWVTPGPRDLALMMVVGIVAIICFICITKALKLADASVVAPFQYSSIVWAAALGWLIWGDVPDRNTVLGVFIIVGSGLAVWWREQTRGTAEPAAVPVP